MPRALRRALPALAALVPLLLTGCRLPRVLQKQTLHVLVVPTGSMEWLERDYRFSKAWDPLLEQFRQLRPEVSVEITIQPEAGLAHYLRQANSRGLGPDLLLVRAPVAVALLSHHLIEPLPHSKALQSSLELLGSFERSRVQTPQGVAGLPVFNELTLACYDKTQISQPPATLSDLLALAASGRPVGISVDPIGIWWTAGSLGAQEAMVPLIVGRHGEVPRNLERDRQSLRSWLLGLRQMALQSRVDVGSGPQELSNGLETGRLNWIPCFSTTLPRLDRLMGDRLGVAPLPSGPGGMPSPFSTLRVWALGVDSSEEQRRLALSLAQLSLNPLLQRIITLSTRTVLPANRFVQVPVASSGRLAALAQAQGQFNQGTPLLAMAFSADRVQLVLPTIENVVSQVMVGVITPAQGSEILLRLRPPVAPRR